MSVFRTVHIVRIFICNNILFCTVELLVLVQLLIQRRSRKKRPRFIQYIFGGNFQVPGGEKIERGGRKRFIFWLFLLARSVLNVGAGMCCI